MQSTALVFSTDENFAPLAKGLVLSILDQVKSPDEFVLHLVDIGCSQETLAWMRERNVRIKKFDRGFYLARHIKNKLKSYQDAQLCRPFIPNMFPDFNTYIWCDTDIWIQDMNSLRLFRDLAESSSPFIAVSPLIDLSYQYFYNDCTEFTSYNYTWFREAYGSTTASTYSKRAILSSGIFALNARSEVWSLWSKEINTLLQREFESHNSLHLAEQTALNYLAYATGKYVPVSALHNYNCHIGRAKRDNSGFVVIDIPPYPKIGVVHLTYTGKMIGQYINDRLLFQGGEYLSVAELERLRKIAHY